MNMVLYKVELGLRKRGDETRNWASCNVLARNVEEAVKKAISHRVKLGWKGEFVNGVTMIAEVDVK